MYKLLTDRSALRARTCRGQEVRRIARFTTALTLAVLVAACGGGSGGSSTSSTTVDSGPLLSASIAPNSDLDAYRFLTQATFGPTPDDVAHVKAVGYSRWIDEQFDMPLQTSHLDTVTASAAALNAGRPAAGDVTFSWWTHAIKDPAQLRQRVAFALSEIFVISTMTLENGRPVASYLDMLSQKADGNFRDLLEAVALHPAMGQYLSHLGNRKEDTSTGRIPDENFAREIMQLFSIGLYELDDGGQPRLVDNQPVETYSASDIGGLAKVFTGFSWYWPADKSSLGWAHCFWRVSDCDVDSQDVTAMSAYAAEHATSSKTFLGVTIPAQTTADPAASLRTALNRLANHPNTAPFISRQLIQRLVTSNPSSTYVSDIVQVFRSTNGNLRAVVKAILLHREARLLSSDTLPHYGKLREPVLRFAHLLRALPHNSITYNTNLANGTAPFYQADDTSDVGTSLGQTPMRSPTVFNFFRPGYRPPQSQLPAGMVSPEMQITNESSTLSYSNFVAGVLDHGWGRWLTTAGKFDIQFNLSQWTSLANTPDTLMSTISQRLIGQPLPDDVLSEAIAAITAMPSSTPAERLQRVEAAVLLVAVSPSFIVQQ